jgi:hypothetical protein
MSTATPGIRRPRRVRRLLPVTLLAVPIALSGIALANPATAGAERIWDTQVFDSCSDENPYELGGVDTRNYFAYLEGCCARSGGDWIVSGDGSGSGECKAPPPERAESAPKPVVTPGQVEDPFVPGAPRPSVPRGGVIAP